jgi:FkbM family methyltransferase
MRSIFKYAISRVRRDSSEQRSEEAARASVNSCRPYLLPQNLATIDLKLPSGRSYQVVRSSDPSAYERGLMEAQDWGSGDVVYLLRHLLKHDGALIDVGANIGLVSLPIALDGTPIVAFEMLPENCLKLQLACVLNQLDRVQVVQAAVSSVDGLLTFGGEHAWGAIGTGNQVACALRLDTALRLGRLAPIVGAHRLVMKIDVEGHELEVIKGAVDLIAARRPAIVFESIEFANGGDDQGSIQCKRFLESLGYRLLLQRGHTLLPRKADDLQEGLVTDFLAIPTERSDLLAGLDVRELTAAERACWVDEMAVQFEASHRTHAIGAIQALRKENEIYISLTAASAERLAHDDDPSVRTAAQAAGF